MTTRFSKRFQAPLARFAICLLWAWFAHGCAWTAPGDSAGDSADLARYLEVASEIDVPDVPVVQDPEVVANEPPPRIDAPEQLQYINITLEEATRTALRNSQVIRDVGGAVLRSPETEATPLDPAIRATDPRFGIDAALSNFDAQYYGLAFLQKNDQGINDAVSFGAGQATLNQRLAGWQSQISKKSAVGTDYVIRHRTDYDANNNLANLFPRSWTTNFEAEIRQPLLQGAGIDYGQIVGNGILGFSNGVLVARVNTDVSLTEFEIAVRNLVSNVENAYWDLYFAYRFLEARVDARNASLKTWQRIDALRRGGRRSAADEAQARVQYFSFERDAQNALVGRPQQGTSNSNGAGGGVFNTSGGVYAAERRLRLLMGVTASNGRLLRPADEPSIARVDFDFNEISWEALRRRPELRQQRWRIKRRELEVVASRQFLMRRLDAFGLYRFNGFGRDLIKAHRDTPRFDNAYQVLTTGDFQEWQFGLEMSFPIGFRQAHANERNAQLQLARERAIAREQERQVMFGIVNAVTELQRSYKLAQTSYDVYVSAIEQVEAIEAAYEAGQASTYVLLQAQRQRADAAADYYRSLAEYALAVKSIHFEKGSLLAYNNIWLSEGAWPVKAYRDAEARELRRGPPKTRKPFLARTPPVSLGVYPQITGPAADSARDSGVDAEPGNNMPREAFPAVPKEPLPPRSSKAASRSDAPHSPRLHDVHLQGVPQDAVKRASHKQRVPLQQSGGSTEIEMPGGKYGVSQGTLWEYD